MTAKTRRAANAPLARAEVSPRAIRSVVMSFQTESKTAAAASIGSTVPASLNDSPNARVMSGGPTSTRPIPATQEMTMVSRTIVAVAEADLEAAM